MGTCPGRATLGGAEMTLGKKWHKEKMLPWLWLIFDQKGN